MKSIKTEDLLYKGRVDKSLITKETWNTKRLVYLRGVMWRIEIDSVGSVGGIDRAPLYSKEFKQAEWFKPERMLKRIESSEYGLPSYLYLMLRSEPARYNRFCIKHGLVVVYVSRGSGEVGVWIKPLHTTTEEYIINELRKEIGLTPKEVEGVEVVKCRPPIQALVAALIA